MNEYKDLKEMLDIVTIAIEIHHREENFFRCSATASTSQLAKRLLSEIADDMAKHCESLEAKKRELQDVIKDFKHKEKSRQKQK